MSRAPALLEREERLRLEPLSTGARNAEQGVTWVHSYVSEDREHTFCVYDAPLPEAIRKVAKQNDLPVDRITEVRILDPYFYK